MRTHGCRATRVTTACRCRFYFSNITLASTRKGETRRWWRQSPREWVSNCRNNLGEGKIRKMMVKFTFNVKSSDHNSSIQANRNDAVISARASETCNGAVRPPDRRLTDQHLLHTQITSHLPLDTQAIDSGSKLTSRCIELPTDGPRTGGQPPHRWRTRNINQSCNLANNNTAVLFDGSKHSSRATSEFDSTKGTHGQVSHETKACTLYCLHV